MGVRAIESESSVRAGRSVVTVLGVVGEPVNGVSFARFHQPFESLVDEGFELVTLGASLRLVAGAGGLRPDPGLLDAVDLLVFPQMVAAPTFDDGTRLDLVGALCDEARARAIPVVWSVDDYLPAIEPQNPGYDKLVEGADRLRRLARSCDAVIVSTEPLRESLAGLGRPVWLLPNAVDPARWTERPRSSGELRIGWTGSSSHLDDLLMVAPAIARLQERIDCRFVLQGLTDVTFDRQMEQIRRHRSSFTAEQRERAERFSALESLLRPLRWEHRPFVPTHEFFGLLPSLDLDIGICPLLDTPFNRHKSANKFYEYAVTGSLTVASRVVPYVGEVSLAVPNDPESWCELLERHLRDEVAYESELERQRGFVLSERTIEQTRGLWAKALRAILGLDPDARASSRSRPVLTASGPGTFDGGVS